MITGASQADAALLIIDAAEGVRDQTRRHGYLLHLLGIHQVAVVINKMDRVGLRRRALPRDRGARSSALLRARLDADRRHSDLGAQRRRHREAHAADRVAHRPDRAGGARSASRPARPATELALRMPVQAVYKFDDRRIIAGRVESGQHRGRRRDRRHAAAARRARVQVDRSLAGAGRACPRAGAGAGQSIGITLDASCSSIAATSLSAGRRAGEVGRTSARARVLAARDAARGRRAGDGARSAPPKARGVVRADRQRGRSRASLTRDRT